MAYLSPLSDEQRTTLLVVSLPSPRLRRLVGSLGTAPKGTRIEKLSPWDLAWTLVDFYEKDAEVSGEVDRVLLRELGASPLAGSVATDEAGVAVTDLVLRSRDPLRDLAWALLSSAPESLGDLASEVVETIVVEFDEAEQRAKEDEERRAAEEEGPDDVAPAPEDIEREIAKQTKNAKRGKARAQKRAADMKTRVAELETALADANRALKDERSARGEAVAGEVRAAEELESLRDRLRSGTAAEVEKLNARLEESERVRRGTEEDLAAAEAENRKLTAALRDARERRPVPTPSTDSGVQGASSEGDEPVPWHMPVFTAEFYDSIRSWDRKVLRVAFEKIVRLAEDWRHPSLRAIPLEGLPGHYRIRIASDVRLIYRLAEGGAVEVLSLIDREDLTRYIRTAKR